MNDKTLFPPDTPTNRRKMLINGAADFQKKFPGDSDGLTPEQAVDNAIADGKISIKPPQAESGRSALDVVLIPKDDVHSWKIERQYAIDVKAVTDGSVEIWQEGQHLDPSEEVAITVSAQNVVALARRMLWAAGFKAVGIYSMGRGGNYDLHDGATPDHIPQRDEE